MSQNPPKTEETFGHLIPPDALQALGDVVVSFSILEHYMKALTAVLIGVDAGVSSILIAQLTSADLRSTLASLWRERGELRVSEEQLHDLLRRAGDAEAKRNNIMHSLWVMNQDTGNAVRLKVRVRQKKSGRDVQQEEYTAEQLHSFARELRQLAFDFQQYDPGPLWEVELLPYPRLNRAADWQTPPSSPHRPNP